MALQLPESLFNDDMPAPTIADMLREDVGTLAAKAPKAQAPAGDAYDVGYINARVAAEAGAVVGSHGVLTAAHDVDLALRGSAQARALATRTREELDDAEARAVRDGVAATLAANAKAAQGMAGKANAEDRAAALADHLRPWVAQHRDAARLAAVADLALERARLFMHTLELCIAIQTSRK